LSFPVNAVWGFHPHFKASILSHEAMEEEALEDSEDAELEEGELLPEGFSIFEGVTPVEEEATEENLMEED